MQLFIHLLIFILFILIIKKIIYFKEALGPAMVGSVSFPSSYSGKAKTELISKKDVHVDSSTKNQHWSELKRDVDEKKDVDIMHRLPQELNTASIENCNNKEDMLFKNHVKLNEVELKIQYLTLWWKKNTKMAEKLIKKESELRKKNIVSAENAANTMASSFPTNLVTALSQKL
jgi:hypothetical protein